MNKIRVFFFLLQAVKKMSTAQKKINYMEQEDDKEKDVMAGNNSRNIIWRMLGG